MFEISSAHKLLLGLVSLGLITILGTSFIQNIKGEPLIQKHSHTNVAPSANENEMSNIMAEIGMHMNELKENPNDLSMLIHTSELLMETKQWQSAESFLKRAVKLDNKNAQAYYLLGITLHSQDKNIEAAQALEQVISINNAPSARYSLGVLYIYYLNKNEEGLRHFHEALKNPSLANDLRSTIEMEVEKASANTK